MSKKPARRAPDETAGLSFPLGGVTASQPEKGRDRGWEARERQADPAWVVVTFRHIPGWAHKRISEIAGAKGVSRDEVARKLLEFALREYDKGRLPLEAVLKGKLTLFPDEKD